MGSLVYVAPRRTKSHLAALVGFVLVWSLIIGSCHQAAGQFIGSGEIRPFVVGLVPVVGPGGVGGVSVDAKGVVARSDVESLGRLREARLRARSLKVDIQPSGRRQD